MTKTEMQTRRLGYARVSTYGEPLDAQLDQLRGAGCTKIYREKVTGAHSDGRELLKILHALAPGDVVTVTRIDRLARSTFDLFGIVKKIVDATGAIPLTGRAAGRHRRQHRALEACRTRRLGGRRAILSAPGRQRAGAAPRPQGSTWAIPLPSGRGPPAPRGGRYAARARG
jgi:hypothetical protein